MRLLLVPDPTSPSGEDAFCREVSRRAPALGHETQVCAVPNEPVEAALDRLQAAGFASGCDVVLINSLQPAALLAAKAAGKRAVVRLVESYAAASEGAIAEVMKLAKQADLVMVPSKYLAGLLHQWGANGSVVEIPYAYDRIMAQQIALVTMRASRPQGFAIVAAGSFNRATRPGFETLISALARLRLDWHLTLVGAGPERGPLEERAVQSMVGNKVQFLPAMTHEKLMEYFRAAKAYVDPCGLDGFPTLALHALSEGCPVIAARAGAVTELIEDSKNGLLFNPGDTLGLSEAVTTLSSVRGLSLSLIAEGIKTVEKRSWDATVAETFNALGKIR